MLQTDGFLMIVGHRVPTDQLIETLPVRIGGGTQYEPVLAGEHIDAKFAQVTLG